MGVIRKETILGEMLLFSFHPQLKAKNTLAHPALVPLLQPLLPSPLFPPALTSHPGSRFPLGSHGDLALLPLTRLPTSSSSEETPLSRYVSEHSNSQHLECFQNILTDNLLKGHSSNSDKPALISSVEQQETD